MVDVPEEAREKWSGSLGFILAAVGSAVGLGNIWRFPYITGEYGGGAFVLIYLGCIVVVGLPLMIAEMKIGRRTDRGPVGAFAKLAKESAGGSNWKVFGFLAILTGFILLSYYSVVGGWAVAYSLKALYGELVVGSSQEVGAIFGSYIGDPVQSTMSLALFMIAAIGIVHGGISDGIERAAKILMPTFGVLLLVLLGYSLTTSGAGQAFEFMFSPNWGSVSVDSVLEAMGQSFFTLSLGMGAIMVYGSYLGDEESLYKASFSVAFFDTFVAVAAGVVMFSIIFSQGADPAQGAGLAFKVMPVLFAKMPGGAYVAVAFFLLLTFAAITSAMSLLEVVVSYFVEEMDMEREKAVVWFGILIFFVGIPSVLGFNLWSDVTVHLGGEEKNVLSVLDYFVVNFALPLGGLGAALYAGWAVDPGEWVDEIEGDELAEMLITGWSWLVRIVAPAAVVLIILYKVGLLG